MKGTNVSMHIPTDQEFDLLMDVTHEDDSLSHWKKMYSWVNDKENKYDLPAPDRAVRGYLSARDWAYDGATSRSAFVGFRPAIDLEPGAQPSDIRECKPVVVGTLYMSGVPVRVPQHPTWDGDITDYIPGAKLEMRPALDDSDYQVTAIKVADGVFVADRVLLKHISHPEIEQSLADAAHSPASKKLTELLRQLTSGQCCDCCISKEICKGCIKTNLCSVFVPNDDFIRTLQKELVVHPSKTDSGEEA